MIIASKHFPRIITGAVLVSVLGTALYLSGPYLFGLLLLFTLVGLWEFYALFWPLKANIGGRILGLALGGQPEKGLVFDIDNCSVTRLDHLASHGHSSWRLPMVNQQPWIADASHNAMHQPAGPEIEPATKLA